LVGHLNRYAPDVSAAERRLQKNPGSSVIDINDYRWEKHCRGLFELPVAA
jgi:hypothetical protein